MEYEILMNEQFDRKPETREPIVGEKSLRKYYSSIENRKMYEVVGWYRVKGEYKHRTFYGIYVSPKRAELIFNQLFPIDMQ